VIAAPWAGPPDSLVGSAPEVLRHFGPGASGQGEQLLADGLRRMDRLPKMSGPGVPLASGRAADVYDLGDATVLRRYRFDHDVAPEAELMRWLWTRGFPVPKVHDAAGRDLVMDMVEGPTMSVDIASRPWKIRRNIRILAMLQRSLSSMRAPEWLQTDERIPPGSSVLHLDLHPMNVIMGVDGPVVIDWTNARRGSADFDASMTFVLAASFQARSAKERAGTLLVLRLFRHYRGSSSIDRYLPAALSYRMADPSLTASEVAKLEKLMTRADRS
jgi:aminoglycoside phosphotransferase (APT) family kinase protein